MRVSSKVKPLVQDHVLPGDVFILISYFGFPINDKMVDWAKDRRAIVVEDVSHGIFSVRNDKVDYRFFSLTKQLGLPDGGVLQNCDSLDLEPCEEVSSVGYQMRTVENWRPFFQSWKKMQPIGMYSMSEDSKIRLQKFDTEKQRRNYEVLYEELSSISLMGPLTDGVVPLAFPIIVNNRDELQRRLFEEKMYFPIHWDNGHPLSSVILSVVCDYRYDEDDMRSITKVINDWLLCTSTTEKDQDALDFLRRCFLAENSLI
jgi:hypothetical protein